MTTRTSSLSDLPVKPDLSGGDCVKEAYIEERNRIETIEDLEQFIDRWKSMWSLPSNNLSASNSASYLVEGSYDLDEVLRCIKRLRHTGMCDHVGQGTPCVGSHVALPVPLMVAELGAEQFGAPTDIVLIQANGGFESIDW